MANKIVELSGTGAVLAQLKARERKAAADNVVGVIGYTMPYAVYVHERLDVFHATGKSAKFLEMPLRELTNDGTLQAKMRQVYAQTKSMEKAVYAALLIGFRESQKLVPVDTGALKASGFIQVERQ
jgi:orotate phosphoribosyltransferase-like protein